MPGRTRKKPPAPLGRPPPPTASSLKNLWKRSAFDGLVDQTNGLLQAARSDNRLPVQYRQRGAKPKASEQGGGGIKPKKFRPKKKKRMQAAPSPSNGATKMQDEDRVREEDNNDKASSSSEEQAALVIQRRTRGFIVREGRR